MLKIVFNTGVAIGLLFRFCSVFEHGQIEMSATGLLGVDPADHFGAVFNGLRRVESTLLARHPLTNDLGVLVDEDFGRGGKPDAGAGHVGAGGSAGHLGDLRENHFDCTYYVTWR